MSAHDEYLTAVASRRAAHKAWQEACRAESVARAACAAEGSLPCQYSGCATGKPAAKRYRCGRWFCCQDCHDLDCQGYVGTGPEPLL